MKKTMLIVPVLMAFALSGCSILGNIFKKDNSSSNNSQQTTQSESQSSGSSSSQSGPSGETITITLSTLNIQTESVYPTNPTDFTAGGVSFTATNGVGKANSSYNSGYASLNCMQFNKADDTSKDPVRLRGAIKNNSAISLVKVEVTWYATYDSEAPTYFPVVKAGSSASSLSAVSCDQTSDISGEAVGIQDKGYDVYRYVTTYTIGSGNSFYSLEGASGSASYISQFDLKS